MAVIKDCLNFFNFMPKACRSCLPGKDDFFISSHCPKCEIRLRPSCDHCYWSIEGGNSTNHLCTKMITRYEGMYLQALLFGNYPENEVQS